VDLSDCRAKYRALAPTLTERSRRVWAATEARALGRGGITLVARATGISTSTITRGLRELQSRARLAAGRVRRPGGGRKRTVDKDPTLLRDLEGLVAPTASGDPESPLRWTAKSVRQLARTLQTMGHRVSHQLVAELLTAAGYSLQANQKTREGPPHPDRDAQFRHLTAQVCQFQAAGQPVVSVDAKKKELVGTFKNGGREWQPTGQPEAVNVHDFPARHLGKAIPYGIYDVGRNAGWVTVGQDHDTASFAVASLRRWWQGVGAEAYRGTERLLICADGGGSNGYRVRLWKVELQRFADATGRDITVCHLPPGTSKWNKIEHRLFAYISMNWRGRPLISHEVIVELIGATITQTGLRVQADRDRGEYPTKVKVTDEAMAGLRLTPHEFHGEWNYTLAPARPTHL
jgi:transposase